MGTGSTVINVEFGSVPGVVAIVVTAVDISVANPSVVAPVVVRLKTTSVSSVVNVVTSETEVVVVLSAFSLVSAGNVFAASVVGKGVVTSVTMVVEGVAVVGRSVMSVAVRASVVSCKVV